MSNIYLEKIASRYDKGMDEKLKSLWRGALNEYKRNNQMDSITMGSDLFKDNTTNSTKKLIYKFRIDRIKNQPKPNLPK